MIPAEIADAYAGLHPDGRGYLLGWLVGAIKSEGQATVADLAAGLPLAQKWGEQWGAA